MKLIIDFVPNHSSRDHPWFMASRDPAHSDHQKYKDYYIWNSAVPNNWVSVFDHSVRA